MKALAVVTGFVFLAFWILFRQWRSGRGSVQFVLSAFPLAFLFLIVPVPLAAVQTVRGFQSIAQRGDGSVKDAAALALGIDRPLWLGTVGFLVTMAVAAAFQVSAIRLDRRPEEAIPSPDTVRPTWGKWILIASPLLVVPVGILTQLAQGTATLIMQAGIDLTLPVGAQGATVDMDVAQLSETISTRLMLAALAGFPLIFAVIVLAIGSVFAVRFSRMSAPLSRYSWAAFVVVNIAVAWNMVELAARIQSFEQALH